MRDRKRDDGTVIDPVTDLAEYVQSFAITAPPEPPEPLPPAPPATLQSPAQPQDAVPTEPVPVQISDPEFSGRTPEELIAAIKAERDLRAQREQQVMATSNQLAYERQQKEMETTARRIVAEGARQLSPEQPDPRAREDPRIAEIDQLWFEDPAKARALMQQLADERTSARIEADRAQTKQEIFAEMTQGQRRQQGLSAYAENFSPGGRLNRYGISDTEITPEKVTALYAMITRPPSVGMDNPYYRGGGPLSADVITAAWRDLYGLPQGQSAQDRSVPAAPPGSSRPAPAAMPGVSRSAPLSPNEQRDIEMLAESFGVDKEKLIARRRARLTAR